MTLPITPPPELPDPISSGDQPPARFPTRPTLIVAVLGILLHAYISFFKAHEGPNVFTLGLLVASALPYLICVMLATRGRRRPLSAFIGAAACLVCDGVLYNAVFVNPQGSTAAVGLVFGPLVNLALCIPIGLLGGYVLERWSGHRVQG